MSIDIYFFEENVSAIINLGNAASFATRQYSFFPYMILFTDVSDCIVLTIFLFLTECDPFFILRSIIKGLLNVGFSDDSKTLKLHCFYNSSECIPIYGSTTHSKQFCCLNWAKIFRIRDRILSSRLQVILE